MKLRQNEIKKERIDISQEEINGISLTHFYSENFLTEFLKFSPGITKMWEFPNPNISKKL